MITIQDTKNLVDMARLSRIHSTRCDACSKVAELIEEAMVHFAVNDADAGLDSLHVANAHLGAVTDLTVRIPIRQLLVDIIERLEDSNLFE